MAAELTQGLMAKLRGMGILLPVQALSHSPVDEETVYFGNLPKAPSTSAGISPIFIPVNGSIKKACIFCYSGTAGTDEDWSLYVRRNDSENTLIATVSESANARIFNNDELSITVDKNDYIEIKAVHPAWATNPDAVIYGGYILLK